MNLQKLIYTNFLSFDFHIWIVIVFRFWMIYICVCYVYSCDDPLDEGMATCSNILAWGIPWTEEPGGLQSMGSQRV